MRGYALAIALDIIYLVQAKYLHAFINVKRKSLKSISSIGKVFGFLHRQSLQKASKEAEQRHTWNLNTRLSTSQCAGMSPSQSMPEAFIGASGLRPLVTARVIRA